MTRVARRSEQTARCLDAGTDQLDLVEVSQTSDQSLDPVSPKKVDGRGCRCFDLFLDKRVAAGWTKLQHD